MTTTSSQDGVETFLLALCEDLSSLCFQGVVNTGAYSPGAQQLTQLLSVRLEFRADAAIHLSKVPRPKRD